MTELFERVKAALADKYIVEKELGEGGMATVFLARDPKLNREVAIKVMHPDLVISLGKERFLREIQVTAQLSNPNILALYDSGEADGLLYYVMPLVEGETLSDLIAREQQLSVDEAIRITRDIAGALSYAHSRGVIHRDIKPSNILMQAGRAIVADFGVSRAYSEAGGEKLTKTGLAVGTPAYMSPEQAAGKVDVDGRSDIYSLGCILYEMLVGQIPFTGPTPMAIMARHSTDVVPPPSIMRQSIAPELESIIFCALAKVPADRFRTAKEFDEALAAVESGQAPKVRKSTYHHPVYWKPLWKRRWFRGAAVAAGLGVVALGIRWLWPSPPGPAEPGGLEARTIAVMYFEDLSATDSLQFLADGFTEQLIRELSRVQELDVVSIDGVAPYRESPLAPDSIARALQAGSVVKGTLEQSGDRLHIATRLFDGNSGVDTHRESVNVPAAQLIGAQDSVVRTVAFMVRQRLGSEVRLRQRQAAAPEDLGLRLVLQAERLRKEGDSLAAQDDDLSSAVTTLQRADSLLQLAEQRDEKWNEPIVMRGQIAYQKGGWADHGEEAKALLDTALAHANRALANDPQDAAALELRGRAYYLMWFSHLGPSDERPALLESARRDFLAAANEAPRRASAHFALSHARYQLGDHSGAILSAQRALENDAFFSLAADLTNWLFILNYDGERFGTARDYCLQGRSRFPARYEFVECQMLLAATPAGSNDIDEGQRLLQELESLVPAHERDLIVRRGQMILGAIIASSHLPDSARIDSANTVLLLARADDPETDRGEDLAKHEAYARAILGDFDQSLQLLRQYLIANRDQDHGGGDDGLVHWWWKPLQDQPGFKELTSVSD